MGPHRSSAKIQPSECQAARKQFFFAGAVCGFLRTSISRAAITQGISGSSDKASHIAAQLHAQPFTICARRISSVVATVTSMGYSATGDLKMTSSQCKDRAANRRVSGHTTLPSSWLRSSRPSRVFQLKLEEISFDEVMMLGVKVLRNNDGTISTQLKDRLHGPMLDSTSMHPITVHRSWPVAMVGMYRQLCTSQTDLLRATNNLLQRFTANFFPEHLVKHLGEIRHRPAATVQKTCTKAIWLVLPFHPSLVGPIRLALRSINERVDLSALYIVCFGHSPPQLRVAWTNGGPHHVHQVRHNMYKVHRQWTDQQCDEYTRRHGRVGG